MAAMPMPVPAPMPVVPAVVPTPMAVVVPTPMMAVPVMTPAHLFRLQAIDFALAGDGRMGILIDGKPSVERLRHQRRGLGGGANGSGARHSAQRNP